MLLFLYTFINPSALYKSGNWKYYIDVPVYRGEIDMFTCFDIKWTHLTSGKFSTCFFMYWTEWSYCVRVSHQHIVISPPQEIQYACSHFMQSPIYALVQRTLRWFYIWCYRCITLHPCPERLCKVTHTLCTSLATSSPPYS